MPINKLQNEIESGQIVLEKCEMDVYWLDLKIPKLIADQQFTNSY